MSSSSKRKTRQNGDAYYRGRSTLIDRFIHASRGIKYAWQKEANFRIEVLFALVVFGGMAVLPLSGIERALLVVVVGFVLVLEAINSVFERLLDVVHPQFSAEIKRIKDTMAGIVFLGSLTAVAVGMFILVQPLLHLDQTIAGTVARLRVPSLEAAAATVTVLGDWRFIAVLTAVLGAALISKKRYRLAGLLVGGVATGSLFVAALKALFARSRPVDIPAVIFGPLNYSFPSGHVFLGTLFWMTVGYILVHGVFRKTHRPYLWIVPGVVIPLIALTRVVLAVHWVSDVLAGFLFGLFWFLLWFGINDRLARWGRAHSESVR